MQINRFSTNLGDIKTVKLMFSKETTKSCQNLKILMLQRHQNKAGRFYQTIVAFLEEHWIYKKIRCDSIKSWPQMCIGCIVVKKGDNTFLNIEQNSMAKQLGIQRLRDQTIGKQLKKW